MEEQTSDPSIATIKNDGNKNITLNTERRPLLLRFISQYMCTIPFSTYGFPKLKFTRNEKQEEYF